MIKPQQNGTVAVYHNANIQSVKRRTAIHRKIFALLPVTKVI